ncbi:glucose 1-dehydrogenase [Rhizobium laguerreae]|nr:glucose 1-dehydrogenase [Rhizobium laguerreae]
MTDSKGLFDLTGRVALVTGGNGGIGLSIAKALGQAGAKIYIVGRNKDKGGSAIADLADRGVVAHFMAANVSAEDQAQSSVDQCIKLFGRLDILVNNAGITARRRPEDLVLEDWTNVLDVNLTSAFLCSRAAFPAFQRQGGGKVINIGSLFSTFGSEFSAAYGASKGAIVQFTKALAVAWASKNIQANTILPGWITTEMGSSVQNDPDGRSAKIVARTPAGRWGQVEDLQGTAVFLASRASDFVTGTSIPVDGGYSSAG